MYKKQAKQISLQENPISFTGARLNPENRWVQLANIIPWNRMEEKYNETFTNPSTRNPAKSCRMASGSFIKERMPSSHHTHLRNRLHSAGLALTYCMRVHVD